MKYFVTAFVTAILVFLAATVYYKGLPNFTRPGGISVTSTEETPTPTAAVSSTPKGSESENSVLIKLIKDSLVQKHGSSAANLNITVSKIEGEYASGGASGEDGGGMWFAARLNGKWTLVWDGNGQINCIDISPFSEFPSDMIPECWDSSTSAVIAR